ncbi:DUF6503 family protein [Pontimicrobium sp. MEBiC06410]
MKPIVQILILSLCLTSCKDTVRVTATKAPTPNIIKADTLTPAKTLSKAELLVNKAIKAHGGRLYNNASYTFIFRKKEYSFTNNGSNYRYEMKNETEGDLIYDVLENGTLTRVINDKRVNLNEKQIKAYSGALNSVIYFATLPHKLNDAAVNKAFKGTTSIKNEDYNIIEITFNKEGGGQDHDDEFYYWINTKTNTIDFLAYNYLVNGGGVRFRSAYNARTVDGIRFQDYINFKAPANTPLKDLPKLYENGELKELSRIETENIINLNK